MIGFGIDEIQAEYVAEIKLRHLNREYITHRIEEVEALLARGLPTTTTALAAIGYKECIDFFEGRRAKEETVTEIKLRSRQYAKRQLTWFRRNQAAKWLIWGREPDFAAALHASTEYMEEFGLL